MNPLITEIYLRDLFFVFLAGSVSFNDFLEEVSLLWSSFLSFFTTANLWHIYSNLCCTLRYFLIFIILSFIFSDSLHRLFFHSGSHLFLFFLCFLFSITFFSFYVLLCHSNSVSMSASDIDCGVRSSFLSVTWNCCFQSRFDSFEVPVIRFCSGLREAAPVTKRAVKSTKDRESWGMS